MSLANFRGLDFLRVSEDLIGRLGFKGLFREGIDQIRNVDWAKRYLWAVEFIEPKPPKPFDEFFPATDIDITDAILESFNFESGQSTYRAPQKTSARTLTMTFYDNSQNALQNWISDWIKIDITNGGRYMSCLNDRHEIESDLKRRVEFDQSARVWPVRKLRFFRLNNAFEPMESTQQTLYIYPEGDFNISGSSASEANTFSLTFVVVGDSQAATRTEKSNSSVIQRAKRETTRLLGRFT